MAGLLLDSSTPMSGLGTISYTVVTTGLYTLRYKCFLPYIAAGNPAQTTVPSGEITDITCAADTAGSLNSTYFNFNTSSNLYPYYVWYNINSAGVDPAPAGRIGIAVAAATGTTAANIASATRTAIAAATSQVTVSGATTHVILTNPTAGLATDAANGTASPGFSYSITQGSFGVPPMSGLNVIISGGASGATVLQRSGYPTPTQQILGGSVLIQATAADVISFALTSLSDADSALNAVKSIVNLFSGE